MGLETDHDHVFFLAHPIIGGGREAKKEEYYPRCYYAGNPEIEVDTHRPDENTACLNEKFSVFFKILSIDLLHLVFNEPERKVNNQRTS